MGYAITKMKLTAMIQNQCDNPFGIETRLYDANRIYGIGESKTEGHRD